MKKLLSHLLITIPLILNLDCSETGQIQHTGSDGFKKPSHYNFELVAYTADIDDPDADKRCFYKVFIDKVEEGRTTTGLDSQKKNFKASLNPNRHLLIVEKWILDEKQGKYVKLNNIDQPKPNFYYFNVPENRIVTVEMMVQKTGFVEYTLTHEHK